MRYEPFALHVAGRIVIIVYSDRNKDRIIQAWNEGDYEQRFQTAQAFKKAFGTDFADVVDTLKESGLSAADASMIQVFSTVPQRLALSAAQGMEDLRSNKVWDQTKLVDFKDQFLTDTAGIYSKFGTGDRNADWAVAEGYLHSLSNGNPSQITNDMVDQALELFGIGKVWGYKVKLPTQVNATIFKDKVANAHYEDLTQNGYIPVSGSGLSAERVWGFVQAGEWALQWVGTDQYHIIDAGGNPVQGSLPNGGRSTFVWKYRYNMAGYYTNEQHEENQRLKKIGESVPEPENPYLQMPPSGEADLDWLLDPAPKSKITPGSRG